MSTSVPARARRTVSALAAAALALTGLLVATTPAAPAAAAGPELVIDDFSASPLGARSLGGNSSSINVIGGAAQVSIDASNGTPYAEIRWTFPSTVDLTDGKLTHQLQMDYANAWGDPDATNPVMMGIYVETATGTMSRGGTGLFAGSGKFVANFTQQGPDDYRYLTGTGDLTKVRSIYVQFLSSSNSKPAGITIDRLAAVGSEDMYLPPTFTVLPIDVQPGQAVNQTVAVAGYPMPQITFLDPLPSWLTATVSGRNVTFTGTPTATGTSTFRMKATTLSWLALEQTVTVRVYKPPTLTGSQTLRARAGESFTHTLTVTGAPLPTEASFSPALPTGLSAVVTPTAGGGGTLTISGTPTGPVGAYPTRATVSNDFAGASLDLDLTVAGPPSLPALANVLVGVNQAITPVDVPVGGYPLATVSATGLPPGVAVVATATGARVAGTPTSGGIFPVTLTATNGVGTTATTTFTMTVGTAPELTVDPAVDTTVGETVNVPVIVTGLPAATVTATGLPDGVTVVPDGGNWRLTGSPTRAGMGEHVATVTATNAVGSDDATVRFTVAGAPELTVPGPVEATVSAPVDVTVAATGFPVPALTGANLPPGLEATDDGAGHLRIHGTPTTRGTWDVAVTGTSTEGTDTGTLTIEVGTAPVFDDGDSLTLTVREGTAVSHLVPVSSYPSHTVAVVGPAALPAGLSLAPDGTLSGSPAAGSADTGSGHYDVVLRATNRSGSDDLALRIVVLSAPTTDLPATISVDADTTDEVVFTTGGWDRPTVTVTGLPTGLALARVNDSTWRLSGTVARADMGRHAITVTVENAYGRSARTIDLDVLAPFRWDDGPTEVITETGVAMTPIRFRGTGYPMPTWYGLLTDLPTWMTMRGAGVSATSYALDFVGTPPAAGTVVVSDKGGDTTEVRTVTVHVQDRPVIGAPASIDVLADAPVDTAVTVTGSPAAPLTASGLPAGLSLVAGAEAGQWRITGTPTRAAAGVHEVTLTADNGLVATRSLTLTLGAAPSTGPSTTLTTEVGQLVGTSFGVTGYPKPTITFEGLPPGVLGFVDAVPPEGPPIADPEGMVSVSGRPTEAGTWTTRISATNAHGTSVTVVTMVAQQGAALADETLDLVLVEGVASTRSLPLVGYPNPAVTVAGEVPGMTLTHTPGTDPVLSGTPAPGSAGTYVLDVTAANTVGGTLRQDAARLTVRVDARAAVTAGTQTLEASVGSPVDRVVTVTGSPAPALTATGLPDGLSLVAGATPGQWRITGTPTAGSGGRHTAHLVAENGVLDAATADVTVEVAEPVRLAIGGDGNVALREGTPTRVGVRASGGWPTAAALRVEGALPAGLTFVDAGDGTGSVVGTPAAGTAGRWSLAVVADNGSALTRAALVLDVAAAPVTVPPPAPGGSGPASGGTAGATVPAGGAGGSARATGGSRATSTDDPASDAGSPADPAAPADPGAAGTADGAGDDGKDTAAGGSDDDAQAAPPVLDPEETISTETTPRPWWWVLGAAFVGAVLLGLRTLERKLRSL